MIDKFGLLIVGRALAQGNGTTTTTNGNQFWSFFQLGTLSNTSTGTAENTAQRIIGIISTWILGVAAIVAFIYLILSGLKYITAGGDAAKATEARTGIINAIIGIAVISLAFFIMRFALSVGTSVSGTTVTP